MDQAKELRDLMSKKAVNIKKKINARVITISSGKGGVGKSNIAVNLAIYLASLKKRVVVIDADFGLANIEVLLGVRPEYNFYHLIKGEKAISEIMMDTKFGIKFISGGSGLTELSTVNFTETKYFIEQFEYLDKIADFIIIDTGAGISSSVTNFIMASDEPIVVTTPEPTSFTDAYTLIKVIKEKNSDIKNIKLIANRCEDKYEADRVLKKISYVCDKFLDIKIEGIGSIPIDNTLTKAVKMQQPAILSFPTSDFSKAIREISSSILKEDIRIEQEGIKGFMKKLINIFSK